MQRLARWSGSVLAAAILATAAVAQDRPQVIAVNYPLQYMAERLLGDAADVVFPVPADVDPSFWRPAVADISTIQSADLILLNGAGFATWIDRVSLPRLKVVNTSDAIEDQFIVTESITHSHGDGGEHSHEGLASYTWLDPTLAIVQAEAVAAAITRKNLAPAEDIDARLATLTEELTALDAEITASLGDLEDVAMIATHPRYQYFARRYGLDVTALEWDAGAMPNEEELKTLAARMAKSEARVLIWEAAPPAAGTEAATALGLGNAIFPTLAHPDPDGDMIDSLKDAVASLVAAAEAATTN